jgi:hypothetical protein
MADVDAQYAKLLRQRGNGHDHAANIVSFRQIEPVLDADDFVQGLLCRNTLAVVYGKSGSGKTFWTTTLALHVAAGLPFAGRRVNQGRVLYCCMEGSIGFRNRVSAWRTDTGLDDYDLPFSAVFDHINLFEPNGVDELVDIISDTNSHHAPPVLIVVDTLARALSGGNENAPDDMGKLIANADLLRRATQACILFIHHSGKDEALGARGHSSLQAAIDTEIEVTDQEGNRTATVLKQRDLAKGHAFPFTLKSIELGENPYGETVSTCVVELAEFPTSAPKPPAKLTQAGKLCLRALDTALSKYAEPLPLSPDFPANTFGVRVDTWRSVTYDLKAGDPATNRQAFHRGQENLLAAYAITQHSDWVWKTSRNGEA